MHGMIMSSVYTLMCKHGDSTIKLASNLVTLTEKDKRGLGQLLKGQP